MENILRRLPKVDEFLNNGKVKEYLKIFSQNVITEITRASINEIRHKIISGEFAGMSRQDMFDLILADILARLDLRARDRLGKVINATGIIVHTNLGRAPLSEAAAERLREIAVNYSNLEYGIAEGARRSRLRFIEKQIMDLTGAEAALVVNNNAAAVLLALNTLCVGREVVLSRGEIVEIGDSFRISEIIESSGCKIREVGTTNKTKPGDFEKAIGESTGILLKVHTSNYMIQGFTESVPASALHKLAEQHKPSIAFMEDMGSGVLVNLADYGLKYERTVRDAINDGVDVVTFSGDKMLGAAQAGIVCGRKEYISAMRVNPLMRCLRADKLCLAALDATLSQLGSYNESKRIPVLKYISDPAEYVLYKAELLLSEIKRAGTRLDCRVSAHVAQLGGGALPSESLESYAVYISGKAESAGSIERHLRGSKIPIIATLKKDEVILDVRTVEEEDFSYIAETLRIIS